MDNGLGTERFNANLGYSVYFMLLLLSFYAHGGIDISFLVLDSRIRGFYYIHTNRRRSVSF